MAIEAYVRSTATDVQNVQRSFQNLEVRMLQNHQETKARQEKADQKEQGIINLNSHRRGHESVQADLGPRFRRAQSS